MPARPIPDLKAKFQLIIRFGPHATMEDLGRKHFGKSAKTLHGWSGADPRRPVDTVPGEAYPKFLKLMALLLPDLGPEQHERLLQSPANALSVALSRKGSGSLLELLEANAAADRLRLVRDDIALVELADDDASEDVRVRLGERFRFEAAARHDCPYSLLLQHSGSAWGCAFPQLDAAASLLHVPGRRAATGKLGYLRERKEEGIHRFYLLLSPEPFPSVLATTLKDGHALDRATLDQLHDHCVRMSNRSHAIYRLCVHFERGDNA